MIYTNSHTAFFPKIKEIDARLKLQDKDAIGTQKDIREISRGDTYALFDELCGDDKTVTIESFREALSQRGVNDKDFQDKILFLLLQHRGGIQYKLGKLVSDILMENHNIMLGVKDNYGLNLEVNSPTEVSLTITTILQEKDPWHSSKQTPTIETAVKVNITSDMVVVKNFEVTKLGKSDTASQAFKALEDNQSNILKKFITLIRHAFGLDSELRIADSKDYFTSEQATQNPLSC